MKPGYYELGKSRRVHLLSAFILPVTDAVFHQISPSAALDRAPASLDQAVYAGQVTKKAACAQIFCAPTAKRLVTFGSPDDPRSRLLTVGGRVLAVDPGTLEFLIGRIDEKAAFVAGRPARDVLRLGPLF